jgi:single-strand DNA-binding protein
MEYQMSSSLNKVALIGYLGAKPEIRTLPSEDRVASFSLATSESWKDQETGEKKEVTQWHRISVFNEGLVGVIEKYLDKGSRIYLEGSLENRSWDDNGTTRYATEIVLRPYNGELKMLDSKPEPSAPAPSNRGKKAHSPKP